MAGGTKATTFIDNDRVIVTEWRIPAKGDSTGWQRHAHDYVV